MRSSHSIIDQYVGDRRFYASVLSIAVPIMVQNGISNFVGLLDNLMIGHIGTNAISGVAITNQLLFVYYLLIFGASAGAGIFTAQYYGLGDQEGVRYTFRFKVAVNTILTILAIAVFLLLSQTLIGMFLKGEGAPEDAAETLTLGKEYMAIMLIGLVPLGVTNAYAGTLRDIGQTKAPMMASFVAIVVNLVGNALLINGLFGLPALGVRGAAIATVASRFVELFVLVGFTRRHKDSYPFIEGAFSDFRVPGELFVRFLFKSLPLMMNECLWALGQTTINQCYSYRSLNAVAAINIENTLWGLMGVSFLAMGEAVGIIVGQILGMGDIERAKDTARKMRMFTVFFGGVFGLLMVLVSPFFPLLYNTPELVRHMATRFIIVYGCLMPFYAYAHAAYFTIRAGGNTFITFLFDSCFVWVVTVPVAFILSRFTGMDVLLMLIIVQSLDIFKGMIGAAMVLSGIWAKNIVK